MTPATLPVHSKTCSRAKIWEAEQSSCGRGPLGQRTLPTYVVRHGPANGRVKTKWSPAESRDGFHCTGATNFN